MIVIPKHLKGCDYCGSKRIHLDDNLSLADAKLILKECPNYGIVIKEEKPKKKD